MYFLFQTGTFNKSVWFIHFMRLKNKAALITGGETGIGKPEDIAYGVLLPRLERSRLDHRGYITD